MPTATTAPSAGTAAHAHDDAPYDHDRNRRCGAAGVLDTHRTYVVVDPIDLLHARQHPSTPSSIPHTRDDGRVEWRDDPAEFRLETYRDERGVPGMLSHPPLPRARLLGGTAAGDPPSPWWEGDGRGRA